MTTPYSTARAAVEMWALPESGPFRDSRNRKVSGTIAVFASQGSLAETIGVVGRVHHRTRVAENRARAS